MKTSRERGTIKESLRLENRFSLAREGVPLTNKMLFEKR